MVEGVSVIRKSPEPTIMDCEKARPIFQSLTKPVALR